MQNDHIPFFPPIVKPLSKIRFANLTPYASAIHISLDGHNTQKGIKYKEFTYFSNIIAGEHNVSIYLPDKPQKPIYMQKFFIPAVNKISYCFIGTPRLFRAIAVNNTQKPPRSQCYVKFVHASPNLPPLDIFLMNEKEIGSGLKYAHESRNHIISGGRHEIGFKLANRNMPILTTGSLSFVYGKSYTIYIVGQPNAHPSLQAIVMDI